MRVAVHCGRLHYCTALQQVLKVTEEVSFFLYFFLPSFPSSFLYFFLPFFPSFLLTFLPSFVRLFLLPSFFLLFPSLFLPFLPFLLSSSFIFFFPPPFPSFFHPSCLHFRLLSFLFLSFFLPSFTSFFPSFPSSFLSSHLITPRHAGKGQPLSAVLQCDSHKTCCLEAGRVTIYAITHLARTHVKRIYVASPKTWPRRFTRLRIKPRRRFAQSLCAKMCCALWATTISRMWPDLLSGCKFEKQNQVLSFPPHKYQN